MEYKTVKIPKQTYDLIEQTRNQLAIKGIESLPKEFREITICPICGQKLQGFDIEYSHIYCPTEECGYNQKNLKVNVTDAFAIGAIVGLGTAALLYLIFKGGKK